MKNTLPESLKSDPLCTPRIFTLSPHFTKADQAIADLTISHPQTVAKLSARKLGHQCGVSEASVIRFVQKLGYKSLDDFRQALQYELLTSQTSASRWESSKDSPAAILSQVVSLCSQALQSLTVVLDINDLSRAANEMEKADSIHFFSAGGSIRISQHAAFKLMRMGYLSIAYSEPFTQMAQASLIGKNAVAFGISYTGSTKSICDALSVARDRGVVSICLTNFAGTQITECADIKLITGAPGGVLAANSAQSRVSQLAVLDTLCALIPLRNGGEEEIPLNK